MLLGPRRRDLTPPTAPGMIRKPKELMTASLDDPWGTPAAGPRLRGYGHKDHDLKRFHYHTDLGEAWLLQQRGHPDETEPDVHIPGLRKGLRAALPVLEGGSDGLQSEAESDLTTEDDLDDLALQYFAAGHLPEAVLDEATYTPSQPLIPIVEEEEEEEEQNEYKQVESRETRILEEVKEDPVRKSTISSDEDLSDLEGSTGSSGSEEGCGRRAITPRLDAWHQAVGATSRLGWALILYHAVRNNLEPHVFARLVFQGSREYVRAVADYRIREGPGRDHSLLCFKKGDIIRVTGPDRYGENATVEGASAIRQGVCAGQAAGRRKQWCSYGGPRACPPMILRSPPLAMATVFWLCPGHPTLDLCPPLATHVTMSWRRYCWLQGNMNGRSGLFPVDYVVPVGRSEARSAVAAAAAASAAAATTKVVTETITTTSVPQYPQICVCGISYPRNTYFQTQVEVAESMAESEVEVTRLSMSGGGGVWTQAEPVHHDGQIGHQIHLHHHDDSGHSSGGEGGMGGGPESGGGVPVREESVGREREASSPPVVHDGKHSLLQFALQHFRLSKEQGIVQADGTLQTKTKKKKASKDSQAGWTWKEQVEMVKFTQSPLGTSLLPLEAELGQVAVESFLAVMRYMGDYPMAAQHTEVHCVYTTLMNCHKQPVLRDEVYCQIMKQTTNNKSSIPDSCQRGWRLFSILAAYFTCSDTLKPYLFKYLETAAYDKRRAYHGEGHTHNATAADVSVMRVARSEADHLSQCPSQMCQRGWALPILHYFTLDTLNHSSSTMRQQPMINRRAYHVRATHTVARYTRATVRTAHWHTHINKQTHNALPKSIEIYSQELRP
ncbi:Unconventional myosin-XV [Chionoecetes opilio]|uniref:Unconventional myosin-XV n=1 Tax=Chionoecetes opilio TaxID=41210 RepID=A0A8J4YT98_CHIOP|nr:Unconventional myosin-XV [Chionoecetes opilio]